MCDSCRCEQKISYSKSQALITNREIATASSDNVSLISGVWRFVDGTDFTIRSRSESVRKRVAGSAPNELFYLYTNVSKNLVTVVGRFKDHVPTLDKCPDHLNDRVSSNVNGSQESNISLHWTSTLPWDARCVDYECSELGAHKLRAIEPHRRILPESVICVHTAVSNYRFDA
jgi:hypothetical protein